jgi:hypothetical protein
MLDHPPLLDYSRMDAFATSRRRVSLLKAVALPMLAGAVGAALVIAAVHVALPKFSTREVVIDRVIQHDVAVDHVIPHDVTIDIPIPRLVPAPAATAPRSKEAFVASPEYRAAPLSGIIEAPWKNGFVFEDGRTFTPWRIDAFGHPEPAEDAWDDVSGLIGAPAYCEPQPTGLFICQAWREGRGVVDIPVRPVVRAPRGGKPTRAPSTIVTHPTAIEASR